MPDVITLFFKRFGRRGIVHSFLLFGSCAAVGLIFGCGNDDPAAHLTDPDADAGYDRTVVVGQKVYLNAKTNAGETYTYAWTKSSGSAITINDADTDRANFTPTSAGTYVLSLSVALDDTSDSDTVTITAVNKDTNNAPVTNAGSDRTVPPGISVELDGRGSYDPDKNAISYQWRQIGGTSVSLTNSESSQATFTSPEVTESTNLEFELLVWDEENLSQTDSVTITVAPSATTQYNLATFVSEGGSIVPSQGAYDSGKSVTITAAPYKGWQFNNWSGDLSGTQVSQSLGFDANKYVTATFTRVGYVLTVSVEGEGTVNPNSGVYKSYTQVTLTPTPSNANWKFDYWKGDLTESENPATITMDEDKNITAVFVPVTQVSAPAFTPASYTEFSNQITVTMTSETEGASIYYTLDGSEPTESSLLYTGPLTFTESITINARAFKSGMSASAIISANYQTMMVPAG
jgi:hypothetical protein